MNRITEITKRDILDLFKNGLEIDDFFATRTVPYPYFGRLEELDFLKRLYKLKDITQDMKMQNRIFGNIQLITMIILIVGFLKMKDFICKMVMMKHI